MAGFSSVTGDESIMFSDNCSFDGTQRGGKLTTDGQLFIGSTASPHIKKGALTSPLGTVNIGYSSPNITLDVANGVGPPQTPLKTISDFDDFLTMPDANLTRSAKFGWTTISNLWKQSPGLASNPGIIFNYQPDTSSDAILIDLGTTSESAFLLGSCELTSNFVVKLDTLSDETNRYISYIGITDDSQNVLVGGVAQPQNGCFFKYSDNINSGNWQIICGKAGVYTTVDTSVPADTNFHNFGMNINSTATAATFTIDGVTVGSIITTNIPDVVPVGPAILLEAVSGNITSIYVDLYYYLQTLNTARPGIQTVWPGTVGFTSINVQTFTTSGTYTPTSGMQYCNIECVGSGGGGGGATSGGTANFYCSGGAGGGGGYSRLVASASTIGASQPVTIGSIGMGGATGNNPGGNGGDTSVGSLCIAKGGSGGEGNPGSSSIVNGGAGGVSGTGDFSSPGGRGSCGFFFNNSTFLGFTTLGGNSLLGQGGGMIGASTVAFDGENGGLYGAGGGGGSANGGVSLNAAGGDGSSGVVIITEYI